ncbi:MAG: GPP34 family phosphoprotein [Bacteroidales bacterium]|nr:GPP34 family phosphoprotein [Lentimicrobiaceae bacterium]MDD5694875.1 GPP34 family phosphoprotein [Bacteroidales bacterium]
METFLTIPEEVYLLPIHKRGGQKMDFKHKKFEVTLSAAILMELALQNRIDADLEYIFPDQTTPTGNALLDEVLDWIILSPKQETITHWIIRITEYSDRIRKIILESLIRKKVLSIRKERIFLGFSSNQYPVVAEKEIKEIKSRIRDLVTGNDLPELRDMVIISLAYYGDLLNFIFTEDEIQKYKNRIEQLAKMDLIGQAISRSVKEMAFMVVATIHARELLGMKSAVEKMDDLVGEMKSLLQIEKDEDLPEWLRKGTEQYGKTISFIEETGTNEIVYNTKTGKYGLKIWSFPG